MPLNVAVVGSGPSGFYTVAALLKLAPDCRIDIIERLPTPFGLIRGGVAPDHQKTKNVWRAYEKSALQEAVRFFGNVEVGRDVTIDELKRMYDAVVLAVGSPLDRNLGIPGDGKKGVFGAASFVGFGWNGDGVSVPGPDTIWQSSSPVLAPGRPVTLSWSNPAGLRFEINIAVDDLKGAVMHIGGTAMKRHRLSHDV